MSRTLRYAEMAIDYKAERDTANERIAEMSAEATILRAEREELLAALKAATIALFALTDGYRETKKVAKTAIARAEGRS